MRDALLGLAGYEFDFVNDHSQLLPRLLDNPPGVRAQFLRRRLSQYRHPGAAHPGAAGGAERPVQRRVPGVYGALL